MVRRSLKADSIINRNLAFMMLVNQGTDEPIKVMGQLMAFNHNQESIQFKDELVGSSYTLKFKFFQAWEDAWRIHEAGCMVCIGPLYLLHE